MDSIEEKIRVLIDLQDCDIHMKDIIKRKESAPFIIRELQKDLDAVEEKMQEVFERLELHEKDKRRLDREIDELESRIEKSHAKLGNVKSNKEYSAALKEIDDLKHEKSALEDQAIETMEALELLEGERDTYARQKLERQNAFEKDRSRILNEIEALERELENLQEKREGICAGADNPLLKKYDFLREKTGNTALSPVVKGVCMTCHMGIPPQKFNELVKGDKLMSCPHCSRIIYWGDNQRFKGPGQDEGSGMSEQDK